MAKIALRLAAFIALTILTQIGGIAFLISFLFKKRLIAFACTYLMFTVAAVWLAPLTGRTALSCTGTDTLRVQSWFYCVTNRNYVSVELAKVLKDAAKGVNQAFPGTETLILDANFPFLTGFPLLPHLSHNDGDKADIAFYYWDHDTYLTGQTRSPIGYFAFEEGNSSCPAIWPSLRWNLRPIQWLWADYAIEPARTGFLIAALAKDRRVRKIFIEPHLKSSLGLHSGKIRFQGCRAARHDDHIHVQL